MNIEHLAFNIPDVNAAVPWYIEHLGMTLIRAIPGEPYIHFLADASGRTAIEFYTNNTIDMPDYASFEPRIVHIAFVVTNMEAEIERLLAAGASREGDIEITPSNDKLVFLRDPWGLTIQLAQRQTPLQP